MKERVTHFAIYDIETGVLEGWDGIENYIGPWEHLGGGPSPQQKQAAKNEAALSSETAGIARERNAREGEQYGLIKPYATDRLQNGLPFFRTLTDFNSGSSAKAFAPARAALSRRLSLFGDLPSGFREKMFSDLEAGRARDFDDRQVNAQVMNEQAKSEAARLLTGQQQIANPLGFFGAAMQGNNSVMNAPLQSAGIGGLLGGIAGGVAGKAIPF